MIPLVEQQSCAIAKNTQYGELILTETRLIREDGELVVLS